MLAASTLPAAGLPIKTHQTCSSSAAGFQPVASCGREFWAGTYRGPLSKPVATHKVPTDCRTARVAVGAANTLPPHQQHSTTPEQAVAEWLASLPPPPLCDPLVTSQPEGTAPESFSWLKDPARADPKVLAHLKAENDYCKAVLQHTKNLQQLLCKKLNTALIQSVLHSEVSQPTLLQQEPADDTVVPAELSQAVASPGVELNATSASSAAEILKVIPTSVLSRLEASSSNPNHSIHTVLPDPTHQFVAFTESTTAVQPGQAHQDYHTLHIVSAETSKDITKPILEVSGPALWAPDGSAIYLLRANGRTLYSYVLADNSLQHILTDPDNHALEFQQVGGLNLLVILGYHGRPIHVWQLQHHQTKPHSEPADATASKPASKRDKLAASALNSTHITKQQPSGDLAGLSADHSSQNRQSTATGHTNGWTWVPLLTRDHGAQYQLAHSAHGLIIGCWNTQQPTGFVMLFPSLPNTDSSTFTIHPSPDKPQVTAQVQGPPITIVPPRNDYMLRDVQCRANEVLLTYVSTCCDDSAPSIQLQVWKLNSSLTPVSAVRTHIATLAVPTHAFHLDKPCWLDNHHVKLCISTLAHTKGTWVVPLSPAASYSNSPSMAVPPRALPAVQLPQSDYVVEQVWATSHDGVRVPITLSYNRNQVVAGSPAPLVLQVYGAYGIEENISHQPSRSVLMDQGVIFAVAHVRGSGRLGCSWYEAGRQLYKLNGINDLIACVQHLVAAGYTQHSMLCLEASSAGGWVVGAALNMMPELCAVAVLIVPALDPVASLAEEPLSWAELGQPDDELVQKYVHSWSPYHNIQHQRYPHMLVRVGLYDEDVNFWDPAKYVAKLRLHKQDDRLLCMQVKIGDHKCYQNLDSDAAKYAFMMACLGLSPCP